MFIRKFICILLAAAACIMFGTTAFAESEETGTEGTVGETEVSSDATQPLKAAQNFAGTIRFTYDSKPVNTSVKVTVTVEGSVLAENDIIRYRMYDKTVSDSDASVEEIVSGADADPEIVWNDYLAPIEVERNTMLEAAVFFADGSRSASALTEISCIDKTAPSAPQMKASTDLWTKDPVLVSVTGGSDDQSGLLRLEYRLGAEGAWTEYSGDISISARTAVYARSVDKAGNTSDAVVLEISNFDTDAPDVSGLNVTLSAEGKPVIADTGVFGKYFGSDVTVVIDGAVDAASGVAGYQYQSVTGSDPLEEDKWQKYDPESAITVGGDFCGYIYARAVDAVGNVSAAVASEGFVIDTEPPVISNLQLSETALTGNRVVVTFKVEDNYWLETVTVNGVYAGVYISSFTAFRNDDYLIVAYDKVGNKTEQIVEITNINATPFTLLDTFKNLNSKDFTPTSWALAEKAASELQTLITVNATQAQIETAANYFLTSLEGLVTRGDGTLSRELIARIEEYDRSAYTESSWLRLREGVLELEECLNDSESTQEDVDTCRRQLEQRVSELVKVADFTDLDRLIAQCERMESGGFSTVTYNVFVEALAYAKALSRTDSGQTEADEAYERLLTAMGGLETVEEKSFDPTPLMFVILGLFIVASATALFIVQMKSRNSMSDDEEDDGEDYDDTENNPEEFGDICFTDYPSEEENELPEEADDPADSADAPSYIGERR